MLRKQLIAFSTVSQNARDTKKAWLSELSKGNPATPPTSSTASCESQPMVWIAADLGDRAVNIQQVDLRSWFILRLLSSAHCLRRWTALVYSSSDIHSSLSSSCSVGHWLWFWSCYCFGFNYHLDLPVPSGKSVTSNEQVMMCLVVNWENKLSFWGQAKHSAAILNTLESVPKKWQKLLGPVS